VRRTFSASTRCSRASLSETAIYRSGEIQTVLSQREVWQSNKGSIACNLESGRT
jgi:hypothetical protein